MSENILWRGNGHRVFLYLLLSLTQWMMTSLASRDVTLKSLYLLMHSLKIKWVTREHLKGNSPISLIWDQQTARYHAHPKQLYLTPLREQSKSQPKRTQRAAASHLIMLHSDWGLYVFWKIYGVCIKFCTLLHLHHYMCVCGQWWCTIHNKTNILVIVHEIEFIMKQVNNLNPKCMVKKKSFYPDEKNVCLTCNAPFQSTLVR